MTMPGMTEIEPLQLPDRTFTYDGRFIISRAVRGEGEPIRELRYDAGLTDWTPVPIKHGKNKGGIRAVVKFTPVAGSVRNNERFEVAAADVPAATAWFDALVRRH